MEPFREKNNNVKHACYKIYQGIAMQLAALERLKISHRLIMGKWCLQATSFIFDRIFVKHAGNQDSHKISDEFEFKLDRIGHFGVTCPCGRIKFSIDILWNLKVQLTFQTLEFFVTLFSGIVTPRRLKLGTHVSSIMCAGILLLNIYFLLLQFSRSRKRFQCLLAQRSAISSFILLNFSLNPCA